MSTTELIGHLIYIKAGGLPALYPDVIQGSIDDLYKLEKIRQIVTRALKSQDPINLYKALSINEIAELLNITIEPESKPREQITIDDLLKE